VSFAAMLSCVSNVAIDEKATQLPQRP